MKLKQKAYRLQNLEKVRERDRTYYEKNKIQLAPSKASAGAKRHARKLDACPQWLSNTDLAKIKSIYKMSTALSNKSKTPHHVDHIIPLQGLLVSGLHVPWNLRVIPAAENLTKSNHLIEDIV